MSRTGFELTQVPVWGSDAASVEVLRIHTINWWDCCGLFPTVAITTINIIGQQHRDLPVVFTSITGCLSMCIQCNPMQNKPPQQIILNNNISYQTFILFFKSSFYEYILCLPTYFTLLCFFGLALKIVRSKNFLKFWWRNELISCVQSEKCSCSACIYFVIKKVIISIIIHWRIL